MNDQMPWTVALFKLSHCTQQLPLPATAPQAPHRIAPQVRHQDLVAVIHDLMSVWCLLSSMWSGRGVPG